MSDDLIGIGLQRFLHTGLGVVVALGLCLPAVAEDHDDSDWLGLAVTALGAVSKEHGVGGGVEVTGNLGFYNVSCELVQYQDAFDGHDATVSVYAGVGMLNLYMIQGGYGTDGGAVRLHGELALANIQGFGAYPKITPEHVTRGAVVSYSFGYQESGLFGALGVGVLF